MTCSVCYGEGTVLITHPDDPHTARARREGIPRDEAKRRNYEEAWGMTSPSTSPTGSHDHEHTDGDTI